MQFIFFLLLLFIADIVKEYFPFVMILSIISFILISRNKQRKKQELIKKEQQQINIKSIIQDDLTKFVKSYICENDIWVSYIRISDEDINAFRTIIIETKGIEIHSDDLKKIVQEVVDNELIMKFKTEFFKRNPNISEHSTVNELVSAYISTFENNLSHIEMLCNYIKSKGIQITLGILNEKIKQEIAAKVHMRKVQSVYDAMNSNKKNGQYEIENIDAFNGIETKYIIQDDVVKFVKSYICKNNDTWVSFIRIPDEYINAFKTSVETKGIKIHFDDLKKIMQEVADNELIMKFETEFLKRNPNISERSTVDELVSAYILTFENNLSHIEMLCKYMKSKGIQITPRILNEKIKQEIATKAHMKKVQSIIQDDVVKFVKSYIYENDIWVSYIRIRKDDINAFRTIIIETKGIEINFDDLKKIVQEVVDNELIMKFETEFFKRNPNISERSTVDELVSAYISTFENNFSHIEMLCKYIKSKGIQITLGILNEKIKQEIAAKVHMRKVQSVYNAMNSNKGTRQYGIKNIDAFNGIQFEHFLSRLFTAMGYKATVTKGSGDQGADLLLEKFGKRVAVQAKCYSNMHVSNKAVQEVVAAKAHYKCQDAIVVTNSRFTKSAEELAKSNNVSLYDRDKLAELIEMYL